MTEQPLEALDFHPIASARCDRCNQAAAARYMSPDGLPLFFCRHHVNASFANPDADPRLTFAVVSI